MGHQLGGSATSWGGWLVVGRPIAWQIVKGQDSDYRAEVVVTADRFPTV